ncbi:MAG: cupin domain-containing protein [Pseudomonadales bacterium]|nr:cupin domain-containing protein [Pseudomonadales bacterium]
MNAVNFTGITSNNWKSVNKKQVAPGIYERSIWSGEEGKRAVVFEFEAGAKFPGVDTHLTGPEQIFVISGVFNDGRNDYDEGSFINNPLGSAHIPQSKQGCTVLITFPEG